ncbi:hypothetical protein ACKWTF_011927 [Chironomus riparius]
MNDDENFIIEKVTTLLDPKQTGAIPRSTKVNTHQMPTNYWDTVEKINNGLRVCVILRGLPGSGKSYIGKRLIEDTIRDNFEEHVISADDYFFRNGKYSYDASKISEAHQNAQRQFFNRANKGYSPLVVDNTNLQSWEMFPYIQAAIQYGYSIEIMEPVTPWKWTAHKLAQKNKHNVPMDKIKKMMDNYDRITTVKELAKNQLNLDIVKEPKLRNIPKFKPKATLMQVNSESDLIDLSFEGNKNRKNNNEQGEQLSWQKFNSDFQIPSTSSNYYNQQKQNTEQSESNVWKPPPQIFNDNWDQPNEKEITIREKEKHGIREDTNKPQPQRNQRKNKNSSTPSSESDLKPHKKNCPKENQAFVQLRELYPNIKDSSLWHFFEKCKGDHEWCADMLCDENLTDQMDTGDDLTCSCSGSDSDSSIPKKVVENYSNNKKQTPVKAKKVKSNTDELFAFKIAIEDNVKIGNEFYPEHVQKVKGWKGISTNAPQTVNETNVVEQNVEEETLVPLSIEESLITELAEIYGDSQSVVKDILEQHRKYKTKIFIKSSTAKQLYNEILETVYSHQEEAKLKDIENDRYFAMMLHEQEKAYKYPQLVQETNGNSFKEIMDTQAALKEYHNDVGEWQKVEKPDTMAEKLSKEKLYRLFSSIEKSIIDEIFEAQGRHFKKTIVLIQDSLGYTQEQRKQVKEEIEKSAKFSKEVVEDEKEDEFTPEEYACIKKVEELQEEIDRHSEAYLRCVQQSRDHISKKEYHTASYYTSMVNLHKQLCDEKRQELMNLLSFSFLNNSASSRLDLHYLTQEGAKTRLHTFLDAHIAKLREIKKQFIELEIITGRGNHSINGPVIKNMTIRLFQDRNLR